MEAPQWLDLLYGFTIETLFTLGGPLLFSFLLTLLQEQYVGSRDEEMADSITQLSRQNGYEVVVVSCGNAHLRRLPDQLSDRGWDVEVNESRYSLVSWLSV